VVGIDNKGSPAGKPEHAQGRHGPGLSLCGAGQWLGPGIGHPDAVAKHNARNPGKEVVYLNYAAVDPA
jgi:branched-chain amino acid transport system substrate-binding protein